MEKILPLIFWIVLLTGCASQWKIHGGPKECRQMWRVLLLLIKASMEAVELGLGAPEQILLPYIQLPTGRTVGEEVMPGLQKALAGGQLKALPWGGSTG